MGALTPRQIGAIGEDAAARYLVERGMTVLDRNWRGRDGEVDIVAHQPPDTLVVVEVKTRTGTGFGAPILAVTAAKYARLRRLAAQWVEAHGRRAGEIRIDVIGILVSRTGRIRSIDHIEGAFR
jgi:putative endonuclease